MSDNNSKGLPVEGTQFYKNSGFRDAVRIIVVTLIIFCMVSFLALWFALDVGARQAYREARDVRKAFRAVGTEYLAEMTSIYDPSKPNGLADGAAEKIAQLSTHSGTVILIEWDSQGNAPLKFEYRKGLYQVVYTDTGAENGMQTGVEGDFRIYYSFELLKYEAE